MREPVSVMKVVLSMLDVPAGWVAVGAGAETASWVEMVWPSGTTVVVALMVMVGVMVVVTVQELEMLP